jgi:hypothetical protein
MNQDDGTNQEVGYDDSKDTGESTLSSEIDEDDLDHRLEDLHLGQPCRDMSLHTTKLPLPKKWSHADTVIARHQQKIFPSGRNGSVRVDALRQSRQKHPGGGLLRARRQFNESRSISPSDRCFTVSSRSVGLLF